MQKNKTEKIPPPQRKLIELDPLLEPYAQVIAKRAEKISKVEHRLTGGRMTLSDFASGHEYFGLHFTEAGSDYGKTKFRKFLGFFSRTVKLCRYAEEEKPDAAVSQGSSYQVMAARLRGIPSLFMTDYENIFLTVASLFATRLAFPEIIPEEVLKEKKVPLEKVIRYPGLKEFSYLEDFVPDMDLPEKLGVADSDVLVVLRPPETRAHYHDSASESLFRDVLDFLAEADNARIVYLPRHENQTNWMRKHPLHTCGRLLIPDTAVDGLSLVYHADLVVGGGGTMNREAAVLGVPVYSIFTGQQGAVDRFLESERRLVRITSSSDIQNINVRKRETLDRMKIHASLKDFLVDHILTTVAER